MKILLSILYILFISFMIFFIGCKPEDPVTPVTPGTTPTVSKRSMSCSFKINGKQASYTSCDTFRYTYYDYSPNSLMLEFEKDKRKKPDFHILSSMINEIGTYDLTCGSNTGVLVGISSDSSIVVNSITKEDTVGYYDYYGKQWMPGYITITKLTKDEIEGTFQFQAVGIRNGVLYYNLITDGKFYFRNK